MVVGSIIATGEERGEKGRGGKEDIYVLLTEWRRKIKKKKMHARAKGQGMDTNPLHAQRTGVCGKKQSPHAHIQHVLSAQLPRICMGYC